MGGKIQMSHWSDIPPTPSFEERLEEIFNKIRVSGNDERTDYFTFTEAKQAILDLIKRSLPSASLSDEKAYRRELLNRWGMEEK